MANNTYVIDELATTPTTVTVVDDGTGTDWLKLDGTYALPSDIRLSWDALGGVTTAASGLYWVDSGHAFRLVVQGIIENVRGGNGPDFIQGNEFGNILVGDKSAGGGNHVIWGGDGNDRIFGNGGNDELAAGNGNDRLFGGNGDDSISGNYGKDFLEGGRGADVLFGGADGNETVSYRHSEQGVVVSLTFGSTTTGFGGDAAGDKISGISNIYGSNGADQLFDTITTDVAFGGNNNVFKGFAGADLLDLGGGNDRGYGGDGADSIYGGSKRDRIWGDGGNDDLFGGASQDTLLGGSGSDTFHFVARNESRSGVNRHDIIKDFSSADGDVIDLSAIDARPGGGDNSFDFIGSVAFSGARGELHIEIVGGDLLVQGDLNGDSVADFEILVEGILTLSGTDFNL
jgi:serralysin